MARFVLSRGPITTKVSKFTKATKLSWETPGTFVTLANFETFVVIGPGQRMDVRH